LARGPLRFGPRRNDRFPGCLGGIARLRSGFTARRRQARCRSGTRRCDDAALSCEMPRPRRDVGCGALARGGSPSRRPAQCQDHRHLRAPRQARRQAPLSGASTARLALYGARPFPSGTSAPEAVVRPPHSERCARSPHDHGRSSSVRLPTRAVIRAGGWGTRMAPLTLERPKPLIALNGKALIDHVIDRLVQGGVNFIVVNVHYKADQLIAHLEERRARDKRAEIRISNETGAILDTGGGIAKALPEFKGEPFFTYNSDSV